MTTITTEAPNVAGAIETVESHLHPTPSWDAASHPMPTGREEIWRFTPLKRFKTLLAEGGEVGTLDWSADLPEGVTVENITAEQARALAVEAPSDRISAFAARDAKHRTHINVPANAELGEPVVFTATGRGGEARDQVIITVGAHARATIVLRYTGQAHYAEKTDVIVGDGAQLNIVTLQDWQDGSVHGGQRSVQIGRDAHVKTVTASLGGDIRLQENSRYGGPGGELESYGLYFVDAGQHVQHRLFVDHNAPHTKSNVDYRGALQGKGAHSVWIGDVLIRKVAEGIETYESNKNLVLTDGCQADSVPNLEIETGEIAGAGHSSSTGRFDDQQLFYLMSRGIDEPEARRLVAHGFFIDIIRRIGVPEIEDKLLAEIERELEIVHGSTRTKADEQ
ncbi:Fe-S cluster assembly protein SufD [Tessaracoccus flavus]|uniref:Fe-S cluster assembly protein SufD n=1 Tax=Tessaracoccus flavus TaxID=1610493 RepID=A0A1Q2CDE4_9ACTN|nr:Fe-S cluster assembly protein SufD [Tessaracoccus flavus]AQP44138.1 Fe-S cluster assembly protein SufD [Tessaracoccus flavus]SDY36242.1 Iron-regulated ABC transporter permease protein SufD [Tessaracoccus flavus]